MSVLRAEGVSFAYVPGKSVLSSVSLEVDSSERVALRAPSGFGKSTLCQVLAGYLVPDEGRVLLDGEPFGVAASSRMGESVRHVAAASGESGTTARPVMASSTQSDAISPLISTPVVRSGSKNPNLVQLIWQHPEQTMDPYLRIRDSLAEAGEIPTELLEGLGVRQAWLSRFPHELSGGELQRCCIARTLALRPRFIIADEITTMLDAITQVQIWEFLLTYCARHDVGLIMVTHSDALRVRLATRTIELGR